jgi:hypothetical protein
MLLLTSVSDVFSRSFLPRDFSYSSTSRSRRSSAKISASFFLTSPYSTWADDFW